MVTGMMFFALFISVCVIPSYADIVGKYHPFDCSGYQSWSVSSNDSDAQAIQLLEWLHIRQNDPKRCGKLTTNSHRGFGIGASILGSLKILMMSLEGGSVYRPNTWWLWAGNENENCTLGKPTYDCFTLPLSTCGELRDVQKRFAVKTSSSARNFLASSAGRGADMCSEPI